MKIDLYIDLKWLIDLTERFNRFGQYLLILTIFYLFFRKFIFTLSSAPAYKKIYKKHIPPDWTPATSEYAH